MLIDPAAFSASLSEACHTTAMNSENSDSVLRAIVQAQQALALKEMAGLLNQLPREIALLESIAAKATSREAAALVEATAALLRKMMDQMFDVSSAGETSFPWWQEWQTQRT